MNGTGSKTQQKPHNTVALYGCCAYRFPPKDYPVLAFMGAPAAFPVAEENKWLQKYLKWSPAIIKRVQEFINRELPSGAWIGIHLRNGIDWVSHTVSYSLFTRAPETGPAQVKLGFRVCVNMGLVLLSHD